VPDALADFGAQGFVTFTGTGLSALPLARLGRDEPQPSGA